MKGSFQAPFLQILSAAVLSATWAWSCGALLAVAHFPKAIVLALLVVWPLAYWQFPMATVWFTLGVSLLMLIVVYGLHRPRHDRDWAAPYARLPKIEIHRDQGFVDVDDMRDFVWHSNEEFDQRWSRQRLQLDQLDRLDLVLEPLGDSNYFAHAMLSFGFGPTNRVVVSVEARRENGETFGLLPGIYRQFEMIYQVNTERDAFTWRATDPRSNLYVVPVKTDRDFLVQLFVDMMRQAQALVEHPKFYHSFVSNCTTALFDHMNDQLPKRVRYGKEVLLPAQAPALLRRLDWLAVDVQWPEEKAQFRRSDQVRRFANDPDFSEKVRTPSDHR